MWLFAPVPGIPSPLAKRAGISALPAGYRGLWCVSSPGFEPYISFRGVKTIYLGEWTAWEDVSNNRTSLRKFWAFSVPMVSPAHSKSWEHSRQSVFSFHVQGRNDVSERLQKSDCCVFRLHDTHNNWKSLHFLTIHSLYYLHGRFSYTIV